MSDEPLRVDDLLPSELEALSTAGRIKDGFVIPLAAPAPVATQVAPLPASAIPAMPSGVKERMDAVKEIRSSFIATNEKGQVQKSDDGGQEAEKVLKETNPDWATRPKEDPIDAADKMAYLAHILGAPYFEKEYTIFDGALIVTFRTMTQQHAEQCMRQAYNDDTLDGLIGRPGSQDAEQSRMARYQTYKFCGELRAIKRSSSVPQILTPFDTTSDLKSGVWPIRKAWEDLQGATSNTLMVALRKEHSKFERLVAILTLSADRPDFWKADSAT